jgi:hypothetical protein
MREHINNVHNITLIRYQYRSCGKECDTIGSSKSHHPACKRRQDNNNFAAADTNPT